MTFRQKVGVMIAMAVALFGGISGTTMKLGSAGTGGEFFSTTTTSTQFAGTQVSLLSNVPGLLGSVVVSSTTPATPTTATCAIKDATSTTDTGSSTLASFPIQPTQNTYAYNSFARRGLIVECGAGFNGTYTITYSQR